MSAILAQNYQPVVIGGVQHKDLQCNEYLTQAMVNKRKQSLPEKAPERRSSFNTCKREKIDDIKLASSAVLTDVSRSNSEVEVECNPKDVQGVVSAEHLVVGEIGSCSGDPMSKNRSGLTNGTIEIKPICGLKI